MASEEIHLNPYLEKNGLKVYETDLGEWIIQLAGQKPSHMVMPAIHMTKEEVSELFSKEVDQRLSTDIPRLVEVAVKSCAPGFLLPTWAFPAAILRWPRPAVSYW